MSPERHLVWRRGIALLLFVGHALVGWFGGLVVAAAWYRGDLTDRQGLLAVAAFAASVAGWVAVFRWLVVPTCPRCRRRMAWWPECRRWGEPGQRAAQVWFHYQCPGCRWSDVLEASVPEDLEYRGPSDNEGAGGGG